jgi:eukaryotic-like serine/threonine-protein kinase
MRKYGEPQRRDHVSLPDDLQRALGPATTLGSELPRGGMSRVFAGFDETLHRKVAVKVLAPDLAESLSIDRFRREIMLVASLQHPNIVPVLSAGDAGGLPYFVMPFVEGESLRSRLMRGPLSVRETITVMRDVARALSAAHEHGIVHRDIKPDNVMLTGGVATVTDFGVAKALAAARRAGRGADRPGAVDLETITTAGTAIGTPAYMAPEQATGDPRTDHRADIYSLGILGYEMLCGTPPFRGRSAQQLMAAQLAGTPTPIEKRRDDVPGELRALIMRCLEKEPDARPKTATGVVRALENPDLVSGAFAAPTPTRQQRAVRQRRVVWAMAVVAIAASIAYAWWPARQSSPKAADAPPPLRATVLVPAFRGPQGADDRVRALALAEQIAAGLARLPDLRVAGPPMADSLVRHPPPDSASSGVPTLTLDGLLQHTAAQTRLTTRLVDQAGFTVWGNTFGFADADPLTLQDHLANAVLADLLPRLRARLGIPDPEGPAR